MTGDYIQTDRIVTGLAAVLLLVVGWLFNIIITGHGEMGRQVDQLGQRVSHLEALNADCQRRAKQ